MRGRFLLKLIIARKKPIVVVVVLWLVIHPVVVVAEAQSNYRSSTISAQDVISVAQHSPLW